MKVLLVQLPVQSCDFSYAYEHIPLAVGYLSALLRKRPLNADVQILDNRICAFGSDSLIVKSILEHDPDIVGFSCYLWNIERTMYIARQLRQCGCKAIFIAGGPEITEDNEWVISSDVFDIYIVGEGEEAFTRIICKLMERQSRPKGLTERASPPDVNSIPSPYINGVLSASFAKTVLLESARGCCYRCSYCYYHRSSAFMRFFEIDRVLRNIEWSLRNGISEIIFIDPSFLARPDIKSFLRVLSCANSDRIIQFYAEANAEHCSRPIAELMARAGFVQVEVGLQSINKKALRLVKRTFMPDRFLEGIRALQEFGIKIALDLIVGLPGDSLDDVMRSVDFVVENELFDELNLYPLSILPGTEIRKYARTMGIGYMSKPPYYITETPYMKLEDIKEAFRYAEDLSGFDFFPPEVPVCLDESINMVTCLEMSDIFGTGMEHPDNLASVLSIKLKGDFWWKHLNEVKNFVKKILRENLYMTLNWIIPVEYVPAGRYGLECLQNLYFSRNHPSDREFFSTRAVIGSIQVFVVLNGNSWIWIPPDLSDGEFRVILPPEDDMPVLEIRIREILSEWTDTPDPPYRITEVMS